ncbi:hypothetical protein TWF594_010660 [Orbilia oligospora]|nr:hypothetical protein TWF103_004177 [Orbilia oligospora]KAF3149551.1 hypothetical protein TWF594_010660 [Orbilia oligospora]
MPQSPRDLITIISYNLQLGSRPFGPPLQLKQLPRLASKQLIRVTAAKLLKKNPHLPPGTVAAHKHIESLPVWNLSLLYI